MGGTSSSASSSGTAGSTTGAGGACAASDGGACGPPETECAGSCQPTCQLASGQQHTVGGGANLATSAGFVFWTTGDGHVTKVPTSGGAFTSLATSTNP